MPCQITQLTLDAVDVARLSEFWSLALGYRAVPDEDGSILLVPPDDAQSKRPTVWLQPVGERKAGKNRCHPDLEAADPAAEVTRLIQLGATRADIGQSGDEGFVVLTDPEGNEFCVLGANTGGA